jgi:hypothetical protein
MRNETKNHPAEAQAERQGAEHQGAERQGAEHQGAERQGAERQGAERQGAERQGAERQGAERQGAERQGAERQGAERAWWLSHLPAAICLGAAVIVFLLSFLLLVHLLGKADDGHDPSEEASVTYNADEFSSRNTAGERDPCLGSALGASLEVGAGSRADSPCRRGDPAGFDHRVRDRSPRGWVVLAGLGGLARLSVLDAAQHEVEAEHELHFRVMLAAEDVGHGGELRGSSGS